MDTSALLLHCMRTRFFLCRRRADGSSDCIVSRAQEDAHTVELALDPEVGTSLFAVFDGHGGRQVADLCSENVVSGMGCAPTGQCEANERAQS